MKAILAGTFDPFTLGHLDIAKRAKSLFDDVVIAVASDTGKDTVPLDVRTQIVRASVSGVDGITVEPFSGLLSDYLTAKGECVLVRGIRNSRDMEYERDHARIYKSLCGKDAVCFITSAEYEHVSSTVVRELAALNGALDGYVADGAKDIITKYYGKRDI